MTTKSNEIPKTAASIPTRSPLRVGLLVAGAILVVWLGIKGWRIGRALTTLLSQQAAAESLLADGLINIQPQTAAEMVTTLRQNVLILRDETAVFMPLTPFLGWLPKVGPLATAAPQLMEMADAGSETAVYAYAGLAPALELLQAEDSAGSPLPGLIAVLAEARPNLQLAQAAWQRVAVARSQIENVDEFPARIQSAFRLFDEWLPLSQDGLVMIQVVPEILGHEGERTYLLLAQNEDEIRATGGFISGVALLTVNSGEILALDFQDASAFDQDSLARNSEAYGYPPGPLRNLMGSDYFLLRDANYWPDFPFSAQKAIELYRVAEPTAKIDGVIAFDQQFISLLVAATGPVKVVGSNTTITAANAVDSFRSAFNIKEGQTPEEWLQNRKAFLSTFASAIRQKIEAEPATLDFVTLARNMYSALNNRHLQLYMADEEVTAVLAQLDWDGRLENPTGQDFLLVLDTNMGFNKTNIYIERTFDYSVDLSMTPPEAQLSVAYTHTGPENETPCLQWVPYGNAPTYLEVADQCYFSYLRVYAPPTSQLQSMSQHVIPADMLITGRAWESEGQAVHEFADFVTFTNFFMIPRTELLTTEVVYTLPETAVQQQTYRLLLRKQAGWGPEPVSVMVTLPPGVTLSSYSAPQPPTINGQAITFNVTLESDTVISLTYE